MLNPFHTVNIDLAADLFVKIQHLMEEGSDLKLPSSFSGWKLNVDVYENQENIVFVAEAAGIKQDSIKIVVDENTVRFTGYRGPTCWRTSGFYHRMEIPTGNFNRVFKLPMKVYPRQGQAKIVDGMLYLILPKQELTRNNRF